MKETVKHYGKIFLNLFVALFEILFFIFVAPKILVFFLPFLIGWLIATVAHPAVIFIEKHLKIRRKPVTAVVIFCAVACVALLIYGAGYVLFHELLGFAGSIPQMIESIKETLNKVAFTFESLSSKLPFEINSNFAEIYAYVSEYLGKLTSELGTPTFNALGNFAKNIPGIIVSIVMCLLSAYFFISEKEGVTSFAKKYTPNFIQEKWGIAYESLFKALGGYFKAQFKIEFFMYIILFIGLEVLHVNYSALIALGIAALDLLPVFGSGTVLMPWAVVKLFEGDYKLAVGLLILWGSGQLFRQIIQPKIVGDSIGLAPLPTLFLIYIGWQFGGVIGMLIAVPIGVLLINLNHAGVFNNMKESVRILASDVAAFRGYSEADKNYYRHYLTDEPKTSNQDESIGKNEKL